MNEEVGQRIMPKKEKYPTLLQKRTDEKKGIPKGSVLTDRSRAEEVESSTRDLHLNWMLPLRQPARSDSQGIFTFIKFKLVTKIQIQSREIAPS